MFDNLKDGDSLKIGEKVFEIIQNDAVYHEMRLEHNGISFWFSYDRIKFLDAEIIKKDPPKYSSIKWFQDGLDCFGVYLGQGFKDGALIVLAGKEYMHAKNWEVLEVKNV